MTHLHRTQVLLEPWQFERLQTEAQRRQTSVAALIRGLVESALAPPESKPGLESILGIGRGKRFSGRNHDEELYG